MVTSGNWYILSDSHLDIFKQIDQFELNLSCGLLYLYSFR